MKFVGPEIRCTNISLRSFGICSTKAVRDMASIYNELEKIFGSSVKSVPYRGSVTDFMTMTKGGHYMIGVPGHAMAVHNSILIDTAQKGIDGRKIDSVYQVVGKDDYIERVFDIFMETEPYIADVLFYGVNQ